MARCAHARSNVRPRGWAAIALTAALTASPATAQLRTDECGLVFLPPGIAPPDPDLPTGIEVFERVCLAGTPTRADALRAMGGEDVEAFEDPEHNSRSPHTFDPGPDAVTIFRGTRTDKTLDDLIVQFGTGETLGVEVRHCSVLAIGSTMGEAERAMRPHVDPQWLLARRRPSAMSIAPEAGLSWWIDTPPEREGVAVLSLMGDPERPDCFPVGLSLEVAGALDIAAGVARELTDPERIRARRESRERSRMVAEFLAEQQRAHEAVVPPDDPDGSDDPDGFDDPDGSDVAPR